MSREPDLDLRRYPQTWFLLDVVDREPRLVGHEIVDLSPGAIELRHVARELRRHAEARDRWYAMRSDRTGDRPLEGHRRELSFGPTVAYWVEHDERRHVHGGRPFRHLLVEFGSRIITPATSAEIGLYFYGRRPAIFGFTAPGAVHGYLGFEEEPMEAEDVRWLLNREMGGRE